MTDDQMRELVESVQQGVEAAWQRGIPAGFLVDGIQLKEREERVEEGEDRERRGNTAQ